MSCCCPAGCPCPDGNAPRCESGDKWEKGRCSIGPNAPKEPCCICKVDCTLTPATPHKAWAPYNVSCGMVENKCACECDLEVAGQEGEWTYTYAPLLDENSNPIPGSEDKSKKTSRSWNGECPARIPDLVNCKCLCGYKEDPATCEGYPDVQPKDDPEVCECECILTNDECRSRDASKPYVDTENCTCVCNVEPCPVNLPDFEPLTCECYCRYDVGTEECPSDKPDVDPSTCTCKCNLSSCPTGYKLNTSACSCDPCPDSCAGCQTQDSECNCNGCERCDETPYTDSQGNTVCCPSLNVLCNDQCVDAGCAQGQRFNWSSCSCECKDGKELCNDACKEPCSEGQSRDADCACYDASAQSLLRSLDLIP